MTDFEKLIANFRKVIASYTNLEYEPYDDLDAVRVNEQDLTDEQLFLIPKVYELIKMHKEWHTRSDSSFGFRYLEQAKSLLDDFESGKLGEVVALHTVFYLKPNREEGKNVFFIAKRNGEIKFLGAKNAFREVAEKSVRETGKLPERIGEFELENNSKEFYFEGEILEKYEQN